MEYNYYILHVTLTNHSLGSAIEAGGLSADQQERYEILLQTKGNRPYLFGDDIYANSSGEYLDYDIPGEALTDEKFANMIREAEKYLGCLMSGVAVRLARALTVPVLSAGSSITAGMAGMWGGLRQTG